MVHFYSIDVFYINNYIIVLFDSDKLLLISVEVVTLNINEVKKKKLGPQVYQLA